MMSISRVKRWGIVALSLILVVACGILCFDTTRAVAADDPESASFYKLASSAAAHVNDRLSKNEGIVMPGSTVVSDDGTLGGGSIDFADAGGMLGYCDEADTDGIIAGWINSALSSSSATYSYSSLRKLPTSGGGNTSALYMYCKYGYLLSYLGLDSTSAEVSFDFFRFASGVLMTIAYITAFTVDIVFGAVVGILKTINPFRLFSLGVGPIWANYLDGLPNDSPLYGLAMSVSNLYQQLSDLSWTVIMPVFLVFLVFSLLVMKSTNRWGKIKKYAIRVVFIAAGIPLLGSMYTMSLDALGDPSNGGMGAATRIVQSTFCDFEAWAKNKRLGVPPAGGVQLSILDNGGDGSRPSPESEAMLRTTCYSINRFAHGQSGTTIGSSNVVSWNEEVFSSGDSSSTSDILTTMDMLGRYMSGSFFYASDWETLVKAELTNESSSDSDYYDTVMDMLGKSDSAADFKDNNHFDGTWGNADIWGNGSLSATYNDLLGGLAGGAGGDSSARVVFTSGGQPSSTNVANPGTTGGLSTMAMYNYLTSKFTKSSVVVFSNERASSGFIRESHRAVNMIGTGVVQVMYFFNAFIMLIAMTIIGWCYGFGILFSNLKRTFRVITSVPFAMLGSIRGIAKVLTYALVMIIEIIGTLFVYSLIVEVLMNLSMIVEQPIMHVLGDSGISASGGLNFSAVMMFSPMGSTLTMILLIVNCIIFILFIIMAVRLRKVIVKSLDEAAAAVVNKFMDVDGVYQGVNDTKKPGVISRGAGAVAQGAGMAVGSKMVGAAAGGANRNSSGSGVPGSSAGASNGSSAGASADMAGGSAASSGEAAATSAAMGMAAGSGGADMGGSPGADMGAGFGTDNGDADDKALASTMLGTGGAPNPVEDVKDKLDEENEKAEDKAQAELDNMTARTDAMEQENNEELKDEIAKEERKEGAKKVVGGAADTAVGVAKMAAAAETGNANMMVDGAKQTGRGVSNMKEGGGQAASAGSRADRAVNKAQNEKNESKPVVADSSSAPPVRETSSTRESSSSSTVQTKTNTNNNNTSSSSNSSSSNTTTNGKSGAPGKSGTDAPRNAAAGPNSAPARQTKASGGSSGTGAKFRTSDKSGGQSKTASKQKRSSGGSSQSRSARPSSSSAQTRPANVSQTNVINNSNGGSRDVNKVDVQSKQANSYNKNNKSNYNDKRRNENRSIRQASADKRQAQNTKRVSAENQRYGQVKDKRARMEQRKSNSNYRRERLDNDAYAYSYQASHEVQPVDNNRGQAYDDNTQYNVERESWRPAKKKTLDDSNVNDDI